MTVATVASKGSALSFGASGSLTALAQLTSVDLSGVETETFDASTLDQSGTKKIKIPTGYYDPGEISAEGFFDATAMAAITGFSTATPIVKAAASISGGAGAITVLASTTVASVSYDIKMAMNDGIKISFKLGLSG